MALPLIDQIQESFADLGTLTPEKMQGILQETLRIFECIQEKLRSKEAKEREEGMKIARELKHALQGQLDTICKSTGMEANQLTQFVESSPQLRETWDPNGVVKKELDEFKKKLQPQALEKKADGHKKKSHKEWIAG